MSSREWVWCLLLTAVVSGAAIVIMVQGTAHAATSPVVTDRHKVVLSSTLPACGTVRPPCSYNFGEHSGNRTAEAYWINANGRKFYVWGHYPTRVRDGFAHWATRHERRFYGIGRACWVHHGGPHGHRFVHKCPSG